MTNIGQESLFSSDKLQDFALLSQKEQRSRLFLADKQAFVRELLTAKPKDYQERNWFYERLSIFLAYPLQMISILAGSYLLFELMSFAWQISPFSPLSYFAFGFCMLVFTGIEALRRWLVNTTGYHYLATFRVLNGEIQVGEWLRTKVLILGLISGLLIASGTMGAYQFIKHNAPQAETIDLSKATSPLAQQIKAEKNSIEALDRNIQHLFQAKKSELADYKSYAVWQGKEYLLPEVKDRHLAYDKQIQAMQSQRQKHLALTAEYENKLDRKEQKLENQNAKITNLNEISKETYAGTCAGIWLGFESLLLFMLAYTWVFRYGVKREILLSQLSRTPTLSNVSKPLPNLHSFKERRFTQSPQKENNKTAKSENIEFDSVENLMATVQNKYKAQIKAGLLDLETVKLYVDEQCPSGYITKELWTVIVLFIDNYIAKQQAEQLKTVIKGKHPKIEDIEPIEAKAGFQPSFMKVQPRKVIEKVIYVDRPIETIRIEKEVETQGFPIICERCGKHEVKRSPNAKYCSENCRKRANEGK